jgi:hypothetical protein
MLRFCSVEWQADYVHPAGLISFKLVADGAGKSGRVIMSSQVQPTLV